MKVVLEKVFEVHRYFLGYHWARSETVGTGGTKEEAGSIVKRSVEALVRDGWEDRSDLITSNDDGIAFLISEKGLRGVLEDGSLGSFQCTYRIEEKIRPETETPLV